MASTHPDGHTHTHTHRTHAQRSTHPIGSRADPTATTTLREREFRPALTKRFRALISAIRTTVGYERDALRLRQDTRAQTRAASGETTAAPGDISPGGPFRFNTDAEAISEFLSWVDTQIERGILEPVSEARIRRGDHYTASYLRAAAERGWGDASHRLETSGIDVREADIAVMFRLPVAKEMLELAYTRTFEDLKNVTEDMRTGLRRTLAEGLARGWSPRKMATELNNRVRAVGITRAEMIARTETIRTYNDFALTRYERAGVDSVTIDVEWVDSDDPRVCPICGSLDGRTFTIEEARTGSFTYNADEGEPDSLSGEYPLKPPAHPQCRCTLVPKLT